MRRKDFLITLGAAGLGLGVSGPANALFQESPETLPPLLINEQGSPIQTLRDWLEKRAVIRERWLAYLGVLEQNPNIPVLRILKEESVSGLIRQYVAYEGEPGREGKPGSTVYGYLLKPDRIEEKLPGVVALHSTSDTGMLHIAGVREGKIVPFGYRLAQQGFVVFCPQNFLWHQNEGRHWEAQAAHFIQTHPGSRGMAKMLFDAQRAVDVLLSLEEVDSSRIGAMGHSLGAKEAFYLGAFDERVQVIVSNEGGIGIHMSNWDALWYLGKEIHEFGHLHHELLALAAPKPFLLIGGDSADGEQSRPYIEAVKPVYALYGSAEKLQLRNHGQGHSAVPVTETWTYDWMKDHLR